MLNFFENPCLTPSYRLELIMDYVERRNTKNSFSISKRGNKLILKNKKKSFKVSSYISNQQLDNILGELNE